MVAVHLPLGHLVQIWVIMSSPIISEKIKHAPLYYLLTAPPDPNSQPLPTNTVYEAINVPGTIRNPEQRVAYLGEDIGLNSHHAHWHMDFPFWWKPEEYGVEKDRQGELFDLERLSNDLPFVKPLGWNQKIVDGFYPQTTYRVGGEFPARPDNFEFQDLQNIKIKDLMDYDRRIREAIHQQAVYTVNGDYYSLNDSTGINTLGQIMEPSCGSKHREYYGALHNYGHILLGQITDPKGKFDLEFPGVKIQDLSVDELTTYFEDFDIDLLNALDDTVDLDDVNIKARVRRLNHKPFAFHFTVESDKENLVAVRVFMGPKYDWFGQEIPLDEKRSYMVEIDKFVTKVNAGQTMFHRKSSESSVTIPDRETTKTLVAKVENAINGRASLTVNKDVRHCGYPDRLLLPKGKKGGLPFTLYAILTDYNKEKVNDLPYDYEYGGSISYCGTINHKYPDSKPMGFPFDRVINQDKFYYPNMFYKDVTITFKEDN
uniref:Hemocyanin C-terminal domain-containing protein n=1 Tax=Timema monikensis TaxID=170555 RepID=A0A7R9E5A7_9NEOP|nr:unnamed protein product [Timema monikensis]